MSQGWESTPASREWTRFVSGVGPRPRPEDRRASSCSTFSFRTGRFRAGFEGHPEQVDTARTAQARDDEEAAPTKAQRPRRHVGDQLSWRNGVSVKTEITGKNRKERHQAAKATMKERL